MVRWPRPQLQPGRGEGSVDKFDPNRRIRGKEGSLLAGTFTLPDPNGRFETIFFFFFCLLSFFCPQTHSRFLFCLDCASHSTITPFSTISRSDTLCITPFPPSLPHSAFLTLDYTFATLLFSRLPLSKRITHPRLPSLKRASSFTK